MRCASCLPCCCCSCRSPHPRLLIVQHIVHGADPMKCSKCSSDAITFIRYSGAYLCAPHFREFFLKRTKKALRKQMEWSTGQGKTTIAVGLSGGKDSSTLLVVLKEIIGRNPNVSLSAVCVDEGIEEYRPSSVGIAQRLCASLGVDMEIVSFRKVLGFTLDEATKAMDERAPCTFCGVFRRLCLNSAARDMGADYLAVGLNLDDCAQSVLMNFARGDMNKLARLGPHRQIHEGLVPRILPFREIPEKEIYLFAMLEGLEIHPLECPYAPMAQRNIYRDTVNMLEEATPGTRHAIMRSYDRLYPFFREIHPATTLARCKKCGGPCSATICKACDLKEFIESGLDI